MKALVGAFNQEKALVGAFSVIVQPVVEPMEHYTALLLTPYPQGVANTGPSVPSLKTPGPAAAVSSSGSSSGNPRVLKTGMIFKKQTGAEMMKGVRDDIEEEDSEESYYR